MTGGCRKIVILSVSAGVGHIRAAEALKSAFVTENPGCQVTVLDTFRYTSPFLEKIILGSYMEMLKILPSLYGYLYSRSEKGRPLSGRGKAEFNRLLSRFSALKLLEYLEQQRPDVVICTHPFPLGVIANVRKGGKFGYFTVGAITDLTIHPFWVFPETDLYLVGAEKLKEDLAAFGIPTERIHATGIPIDPVFGSATDRRAVLEGYGLDPGLVTILVMGGGLGLGPLAESVRLLGNLDHRCQIIVIAGKNAQLKEKVDRLPTGLKNKLCSLGFVNNVHQLMACADIMVSKAGGLSCSEALACGLPLFLVDPLPGQEERNTAFLTASGAAVAVTRVGNLAERIEEYLKDPLRLEEMSRAAARLGRPEAAFLAAGIIRSSVKALTG